MIRYKYAPLTPPGPIIHVAVRCPVRDVKVERELALIDSGADCTVLPDHLVNLLELKPVGECEVSGVGETARATPVYLVEFLIPGRMDSLTTQAVMIPGEPRIILGRDILNHLKILLDGPGLVLEIE